MRVLKWFGIVGLILILMVGYMLISAFQSGWWLDRLFAQLSQGWNAQVIVRNARPSPVPTGTPEGLQSALNDPKRLHLESITPAACTHGPNYLAGEGVDFRSRCLVWARFNKGTVRFEFELKGFWNEWKITYFGFAPETSGTPQAKS